MRVYIGWSQATRSPSPVVYFSIRLIHLLRDETDHLLQDIASRDIVNEVVYDYVIQIRMSSSVLLTDLSDHLALITGATGGIGYATALALAKLKCNIAVHYHANFQKATQLASELGTLGVRVAIFQADLSSYDETRKLHKEVVTNLGHPTILFNNAGLTAGKAGVKDISEIDIEDFEKTWRANCATSYLLTQLCMPSMVDKGFGRIIFTSSVAGLTGGLIGPHYAYVRAP